MVMGPPAMGGTAWVDALAELVVPLPRPGRNPPPNNHTLRPWETQLLKWDKGEVAVSPLSLSCAKISQEAMKYATKKNPDS
jgi:hypothetical protein